MNNVLEFLGRTEVLAILATVAAAVFGFIKKLESVNKWKLVRALECVETGVRETYEEYVRAMKDANLDGKLTDDERKEAVDRALARAKEYAAKEGIDLLKFYAKEYLPVLVDKIVNRNKAAAAIPLALGPELD